MTFDGRYVANEAAYKEHAFAALQSRFADRNAFEAFYQSLRTNERKDEFLRVASFYLFLVKQGDWKITVPGYDPVIDYLTNSFKLVALFSLTESLTDLTHQDFYQWLSEQPQSEIFPIGGTAELKRLYEQYKVSFGSIRRCVAFFEHLPPNQKHVLCDSIQPGGNPIASIKKLAEFLYQLRSKFVHEGKVVLLQVTGLPMLSLEKNKVIHSNLTISTLLDAFEEGVLAHFQNGT